MSQRQRKNKKSDAKQHSREPNATEKSGTQNNPKRELSQGEKTLLEFAKVWLK